MVQYGKPIRWQKVEVLTSKHTAPKLRLRKSRKGAQLENPKRTFQSASLEKCSERLREFGQRRIWRKICASSIGCVFSRGSLLMAGLKKEVWDSKHFVRSLELRNALVSPFQNLKLSLKLRELAITCGFPLGNPLKRSPKGYP